MVYRLYENLVINIDGQYSFWSGTQKSMNYNFNNTEWQNNIPASDSLSGIKADKFILNFNNTIDAGLGIEYLFPDLRLRASYRYSQSPNSESTYTYLFPSVNQNWISIGIGYFDKSLTADLSLSYAFGTKKEIKNSMTGFNGAYNSNLVLPAINIKYAF